MWTLEKLVEAGYTAEQAQQIMDGMGQMVPKSRLDDKIEELRVANTEIANRDTQLTTLQAQVGDNETLKNQITTLQAENATAKTEHEAQLKQRDFDTALDGALRDAKARNVKGVRANLNLEAIKLDGDKLIGLDEQLTALKTSDDYLFAVEGLRGNTPPNPGGGGKQTDTSKMTYSELTTYMANNPDVQL